MGERDTLQQTSVHLRFEVSQGPVSCHFGLLPFSLDPCLRRDAYRGVTSTGICFCLLMTYMMLCRDEQLPI